MSKKQNTMLIIISIATLFFAVVGATFAYFTIAVRGNEDASSIYVKTAFLGQVVFQDGQGINLMDSYPGDYREKTFTIENTNSDVAVAIKYNVYLDQTTNEFAYRNITEFQHQIVSSQKLSVSELSVLGTLASTPVPSPANSAPIFSGTLYGNDTHTYTYRIGLIESNSNQNTAQGLSFLGKLRVEVDDSIRYTSGGSLWSEPE